MAAGTVGYCLIGNWRENVSFHTATDELHFLIWLGCARRKAYVFCKERVTALLSLQLTHALGEANPCGAHFTAIKRCRLEVKPSRLKQVPVVAISSKCNAAHAVFDHTCNFTLSSGWGFFCFVFWSLNWSFFMPVSHSSGPQMINMWMQSAYLQMRLSIVATLRQPQWEVQLCCVSIALTGL